MSREVNSSEIAYRNNGSNYGNNNTNFGNNNTNSGNSNNNNNNNKIEFNEYNISIPNEKQPVPEERLSPQASRERHQAVRDKRVEGVGNWLLCDPLFCVWRASEDQTAKRVLSCHGHPGTGKTYIRYEPPNPNLVSG